MAKYSQYFNKWRNLQDRLKPGMMLLVDTVEKKIEEDADLKTRIAASRPHKKLTSARLSLDLLRKDDVVSMKSLFSGTCQRVIIALQEKRCSKKDV